MNSLSFIILYHCQSTMQRKTICINKRLKKICTLPSCNPTKLNKINTANVSLIHSVVSAGSSGWFVFQWSRLNRSDWVFFSHLSPLLSSSASVFLYRTTMWGWLQILVAFLFVWERSAPPAPLKLFCRWICSRHIDPFVPASYIPESGNPEALIFLV